MWVTTAGLVTIEFVNNSHGLANLGVVRVDEGYTAEDVLALDPEDARRGAKVDWMTLLPVGPQLAAVKRSAGKINSTPANTCCCAPAANRFNTGAAAGSP